MPVVNAAEWSRFLELAPDVHLLQTAAWGELKSSFGWRTSRVVTGNVGAQILFRPLFLGLTLAYIAKGPVHAAVHSTEEPGADEWEALWTEIDRECSRERAFFLKVEPDVWEAEMGECEGAEPFSASPGFRLSSQSIQPKRTLIVDLRGSEDDILAQMKQKTRYNIRLAQKKGVVVRDSADVKTFHHLMQVTGERDRFGVHSLEYYTRAYELFHPQGECELLIAEYQGEPLAGLMVFAHGRRSWYLHGASSNQQRERMPTYMLQWEAMRWARARGCQLYDLWGVPDADEAILEEGFSRRSDGLWGVYRFKRGFGGRLMRAAGPWDRVYHPLLYTFYRLWAERRSAAAG